MIVKLLLANKLASLAGTAAVVTATSAAAVTGNLPVVQAEPVEDVSALVETDTTDGSDTTVTVTVDGSDTTETTDGSDTTDTSDGDALELDENGIPVLSDGSAYGEVGCDGTHGDYVSSVAQDDDIEGPRGRIVSEAARSSCGKDDDSDDSDSDDESDDPDDSDDSNDEPEVEATETPGNGRQGGDSNRGGNSGGNGNGNRGGR